jgi:hypothetical protein
MTDQELIDAVAIEVMDGKHFRSRHPYMPWYWRFTINGKTEDYEDWNPLTNDDHLIMVIEKMKEKWFEVSLHFTRQISSCTIHKVGYPVPMDTWYAEHKSIGRAVCLAALEAVRNKKQ